METEHAQRGKTMDLDVGICLLLGATYAYIYIPYIAALSSWWVCWVHVSRDCVTSDVAIATLPLQLGKAVSSSRVLLVS